MTPERVIKIFEVAKSFSVPGRAGWDIFDIALKALYAQREAEKDDPLTPEELRGMAEKPYYHVSLRCEGLERWGILPEQIAADPKKYNYGKCWLAYRHPPKRTEP